MNQKEIFDVTIIGGGPAGLFSAFYSGLRGMKTKIIEYQQELGGKVHVYPEKIVWDVGGVPPVPGAVLIEQMVEQGLTFDPEVVLETEVTSIARDEAGLFHLHTQGGEVHYSKTVITAVGGGILNPQRLPIEGCERFEQDNLHYSVRSLEHFRDKTVMISGGGNSAIDWAQALEKVAKHVFITCRNDAFSCHEAQAEDIAHSSVVCFFHSNITDLVAGTNPNRIDKIELTNHVTGVVDYLPVDAVIVNHGYVRDKTLLDNSPIEVERKDDYFIAGDSSSASSIPGLYAVGDVLAYEGKLNLIAGAFQDAANAVNAAKQWLDPKAEKGAMVSSHNEKFKEKNEAITAEFVRS